MQVALMACTVFALASPAPEASRYLIAARVDEDGCGVFYHRTTGQAFVPRGFSYVRLDESLRPDSPHSTFNPGLYDPERAEAALAAMERWDYTVVRVLINGAAATEREGAISTAYIENLSDFIRRAAAHELYVLIVLPFYIPPYACANSDQAQFEDVNWLLMTDEAMSFRERFLRDFVRALEQSGAPRGHIFSYDLSEWHFNKAKLPFTLIDGRRIETAAGSFTLNTWADAVDMMRKSFVLFVNRMTGAIKHVAPDAMTGIDLFPSEPFPRDPRFHDAAALFASDLDYIGLQMYPFFAESKGRPALEELMEKFGVPERHDKPILMEEFGSLKRLENLDEAVENLQDWMRLSTDYGFRGWILWTYDCTEQARPAFNEDFWLGVSADGRLLEALSPRHLPLDKGDRN